MRSFWLALALIPGCLLAQDTRTWQLPKAPAVKPTGPQTYRFVCDYYQLDIKGNLASRHRVSGRYTRGLPEGKMRWNDVTVAQGKDFTDTFAVPEKREFMEGFTYSLADGRDMLKPEFFPGFPPLAIQERTQVWDTHMLESFVAEMPKLALNTPYRFESGEVPLAGAGTFTNHDIQLTWTGLGRRNSQECAVIDYRAYFNKVNVSSPAVTLTGRSHYWGQIWVALSTFDIEYATLSEDVLGELKLPNQTAPMTINVFRIGVLDRAK